MNQTVVETQSGQLRGRVEAGVSCFLGIPFAAPALGIRRFLPPEPFPTWPGVRDALEYGPNSAQTKMLMGPRGLLPPDDRRTDEDSLVLNIWTPSCLDRAAVLVWIHGGGFTSGSGSWTLTDGAALAEQENVVVVSLNHRLGLLGFLHLGEVLGEQYATSGNAGMLDIVAALRWVRDNIAAFGGDPQRVTIFGESGGASKVSALLAMPDAKGLFQRAVMESGTSNQLGAAPGQSLEEAASVAEKVIAHLGLHGGAIDGLRTAPVEQLLAVQSEMLKDWSPGSAGGRSFRPVVDGKALPEHPWTAIARGACADVPVIIGSNLDETRLFLWDLDERFRADPAAYGFSDAELRARLAGHLGTRVDDAVSHYKKSHGGASNLELYVAISSDFMRIGVIEHAERKIAGGGEPAYTYLFTWRSPVFSGALGAAHTFEIPFIFDNCDRALASSTGPGREDLVLAMRGAWAEFARSGRPTTDNLSPWPAYSLDERPTMVFGLDSAIQLDPLAEDRKFWAETS